MSEPASVQGASSFVFCASIHKDGWHCLLKRGHDSQEDEFRRRHMSIDNKEIWKGTPGKPIFWEKGLRGLTREQIDELNPTLTTGEIQKGKISAPQQVTAQTLFLTREVSRASGYTGDPCPYCGALMLKSSGTCFKCDGCGSTTGCS